MFESLIEEFYNKFPGIDDNLADDLAYWIYNKLEAVHKDGFKEGARAEAEHWLDVRDRDD